MIRDMVLPTGLCALILAFGALACSDDDDDSAAQGDGGTSGVARKGKLPPDSPSCQVAQVSAEIAAVDVDKVDLLFVIDNSGSMAEEQASLRAQFPKLLETLASGQRRGGEQAFPPARSVHLGVVSTDMGLVGISEIDRCSGLGDDGIMQNEPRLQQGCKASYPRFLSYTAGLNQPTETANDFACVAALGTEGCGFEQQLESGLKALWPGMDTRITFLGDGQGFGKQGHGDRENQGFLRSDPTQGLSVVAVVVVSDEEDCSMRDTSHLTPPSFLDPQNPSEAQLLQQGLNVRCHFNQQNLYDVSRYINGFKALRPQDEDLVVFGAIVGVPPETVSEQVLANLDPENPAALQQFYDGILNHALMQPVVDSNNTSDPADDLIRPSCNTARGTAFPPRRIVEVAKGFGPNGIVQSICQEDLGPAVDAIVDRIAAKLGAACLPRPLVRQADGRTGCELYWELPAPGMAPSGTPTACLEPNFPFLLPPTDGQTRTPRGGNRCRVAQLAVQDARFVPTEVDGVGFSDGWYYDDFSEDVQRSCRSIPQQRIAFTPAAAPPTGVRVVLQCVQERGVVPEPGANVEAHQPVVGDPCANVVVNGQPVNGDAACAVRLRDGRIDSGMFCHPQLNACVVECKDDGDCPDEWVCDDSPAAIRDTDGRSYCTASCSAGSKSADSSKVGAPCLPYVIPENGFDPRVAYVESNSPDCGGGICIAYHLDGDPAQGCVLSENKKCPTSSEVERSVYCTCRCDAPDGYAQCACPDGFSCVTALSDGSDDVRGGYCVRNDTVAVTAGGR